jgi:4-hydroxy-tetrahydrodipicolinate reductase
MTQPMRMVVSGVTGRMGQAIVRLAAETEGVTLAGGIADREASGEAAARHGVTRIVRPGGAADMVGGADAVIDFSSPDGLGALLRHAGDALAGRALVVGTTGFDAEVERALDAAALKGAVFVASNFSIGVHVLSRLVAEAAALLGEAEWDVEIVEKHHRGKADSPSGTALTLGEAVARGRGGSLDGRRRDGRSGQVGARPDGEIGFHAVRGGGIIGEHEVHFLGARERIALAHVATDRSLFAAGALTAAKWAVGRPAGRYGMVDLLAGGLAGASEER